jgi:predicted Zn-dependent protease
MATGQLGQTLAVAVGVGASDERGHGYSAAMIANMVNQMVQLKYSRDDELESDTYGLSYMAESGYDPSAMLEVMNILEQSTGKAGGAPEFMQTHPHPESRREQIQAFLKKNYPSGVPSELGDGRQLH